MTPRKTYLVIFLFTVSLLLANPAPCQRTLNVGGLSSTPGEMKSGFISVPAGADGPEIRIPITVVNGEKKGPVLALTNG